MTSTKAVRGFSSSQGLVLVPLLLAGLSMLGPFTIGTPFPAFKQMGVDLGVDTGQMQLVVSAYLLAFAAMSPFHGPLSDALGRRPVIIGGVLVYAAASIGCALSPSLPVLLVFRVLQGLSAGGGVIVSRTIIRDVFDGADAQRMMSQVMMIFGVAPAVAPVVGGLLLQAGAWPAIFWFMGALGLVLIGVVALYLPETHPPERRTPLAMGSLLRSLLSVSASLEFHRVSWAAALSFGGYFLYIGFAPIFVVDLLGKGELDFWVLFVPLIVGLTLGAWVSSYAAGRISGRTLITWSLVFSAVAGLANVALALLPSAAQLPYAVIGPGLIAVGTGAAYPAMQLALLDMFPASRGASVSMFTFFTLVLNGVITSVATSLAARSVLALAICTLALMAMGLAFWLWHLRAERRAVALGAGPGVVVTLEHP